MAQAYQRGRTWSVRRKTSGRLLLMLISAFICTDVVHGQTTTFAWTIEGNQTSLTLCNSYKITTHPSPINTSAIGVPPFYLLAFSPGGVTTRSLLGNDPANLQWTVNQPAGSLLMLSVMDAEGNSGGVSSDLFSVTPSANDACLPPQPSTKITVTVNVTEAETCDPVGFHIEGGTKPYNFTIAAFNSPVITNVTMGPGDDLFTFINRADPHLVFLASASDVTGAWGTSSQIIRTNGSNNVDCTGLVSSSGHSSSGDFQSSSKSKATTIAVAIVIPLVMAILLIIGGVMYKRRRDRYKKPEPAMLPEAWNEPIGMPRLGGDGNITVGASGLLQASQGRSTEKSTFFARMRGESRARVEETSLQSPGAGRSEGRILIQHRDGGAVPVADGPEVQEIPPPYIFDRSVRNGRGDRPSDRERGRRGK